MLPVIVPDITSVWHGTVGTKSKVSNDRGVSEWSIVSKSCF